MSYFIPNDLSIPPFLQRGPGNTLPNVSPMSTRGVPVGSPYHPGARLPVPFGGGGGLPAAAPEAGGFLDSAFGSYAPWLKDMMSRAGGQNLPIPAFVRDLVTRMGGSRMLGTLAGAGPVGDALLAGGAVMAPTAAGDSRDNGRGFLLGQVPLPQARPNIPQTSTQGFDEAGFGGMAPKPQPPMSLAPPYPGPSAAPGPSSSFGIPNPFAAAPMGGPGSMSFGAGDGPSGNNYGAGNASDILKKLFTLGS